MHLLKKTVGFDLEPHVSQFGVTVIMNAHLFRWIKLDHEDKDRLEGGLTQDQMLSEVQQRRLVGEVREGRQSARGLPAQERRAG